MYDVSNYSDTFTGSSGAFSVKMVDIPTSVCTSCVRGSCVDCEFYQGEEDGDEIFS